MSEGPSEALRLDGEATRVSERLVDASRLSSLLVSAMIGIGSLISVVVAIRVGSPAFGWAMLIVFGFVALIALMLLLSIWYPRATYERTRYAVNEKGMEIRRGILWRSMISIPKQRVQHTDVEQGPLMRRYKICKLVIHTAGTQHATVSLEGLEHETALKIRDHLIGKHVGSGHE